jgi:hypothetical protein
VYSGKQRYDVLYEERNYAVSSILRNLSFVAEDEERMARHPGTLRLLWRWLFWNDTHRGPGHDLNPRGLVIVKNALDCLTHIGQCINLSREQGVTGENVMHQLIKMILQSDEERVVRAMDALSRMVIVPDNDAHVERYSRMASCSAFRLLRPDPFSASTLRLTNHHQVLWPPGQPNQGGGSHRAAGPGWEVHRLAVQCTQPHLKDGRKP